jgi:hypothetical protein
MPPDFGVGCFIQLPPHDFSVGRPLAGVGGELVSAVEVNARWSERSPRKTKCSKHSSLIERTNRSAWAFKFGLRGGRTTDSTFSALSSWSNETGNFPSRSRMR